MSDQHQRMSQQDGAQHRDITVMFVDLVGSTELARQFDLESYHRVMSQFLEHCAHSIEKREGYVARFMGDGALAYFGYPYVHEDDAARAIAAAFDIRDWCSRLGSDIAISLNVRCGIASGSAIIGRTIGSGDGREVPVFGDVANLAARLQTAARCGSVLVSPETRRRTARRFVFERSPRLQLKGFPTIRHGWEASKSVSSHHWLAAGARTSRSHLVGRDAEIALLEAAWLEACSGQGGTITVIAEAGWVKLASFMTG